jgi:hypothetical protein
MLEFFIREGYHVGILSIVYKIGFVCNYFDEQVAVVEVKLK